MSIKRTIACDRCGTEKIGPEVLSKFTHISSYEVEIDLCTECQKKFDKFMKREPFYET